VLPYALVEDSDPEAIDLYLTEQDAAPEECLRDDPERRGLLPIAPVDLETSTAPN
jgi:hypothetical protein